MTTKAGTAQGETMRKEMRVIHRYLGFFLAGVMAVYALSGTLLIFRSTDFLKSEKQIERQLDPELSPQEVGDALRMRNFKAVSETQDLIEFREGSYHKSTGIAHYTVKELPLLLKKFEEMHKATTNDPLYFLNLFFGISLLFFVISSFFMFAPKAKVFRRGLYFAAAGLAMAVLIVWT